MSYTTITGYCLVAEVMFGCNGDPNGSDPEYRVANAAGGNVEGRRQWDANLNDGLNSGNVNLSLIAEPGGGTNGVKWSVAGGETFPLIFSGVTYGAIAEVKIRAGVAGPGLQMKLSGLVVKFYKNGAMTQRCVLSASADANTLGMSASGSVESTISVSPLNANNDRVVVSGVGLLKSDAGVIPGPTDILGQIFVFASNCSSQ